MRVLSVGKFLLFQLTLASLTHGFLAPRVEHAAHWHKHGICRNDLLYMIKVEDPEQQIWNDATVLSTEMACPSGKSLFWRIQVSPELFGSYKTPGQFVQLRMYQYDPLFLAMCSAPGKEDRVFEFLVKTTPNIPWLPHVKRGMTVQLSNIMGNGFELDKINANNTSILMCVAGSGIAPIRACIESGKVRSGRLYYGEWTAKDLCFAADQKEWGENIKVVACFSRSSSDIGRSGYVQDVLEVDGAPPSYSAILCGMPDMEESVRMILLQAGILEENILTNLQGEV